MMKRKLKEPVKRKINLEKYRLKDEIEILEKDQGKQGTDHF